MPGLGTKHIDLHMKQMLVELDDRVARDLERVAPAKERRRAQFVRLAIRRAVDLALDRETQRAYEAQPEDGSLEGWDPDNRLARPAARAPRRRRSR